MKPKPIIRITPRFIRMSRISYQHANLPKDLRTCASNYRILFVDR